MEASFDKVNSAFKRKRDEKEVEVKKCKAAANEKNKEEGANSNEWPVFNHPHGGVVKVTPWGMLRKYVDANGEEVTRFEDGSFGDITFTDNDAQAINEAAFPSTPQSLYQNSNAGSSSPAESDRIKLSPGDEAENYVLNGYDSNTAYNPNQMQQFGQEHENYFGMDQDDFECD